jgi:hypothetical protein
VDYLIEVAQRRRLPFVGLAGEFYIAKGDEPVFVAALQPAPVCCDGAE